MIVALELGGGAAPLTVGDPGAVVRWGTPIARMLQEGFTHAADDMAARALREAQVEAERMVLATRAALDADGALLSPEERAEIDTLIADTLAIAAGSDAAAIEAAVKALADGTEAFAAARMNQGIRQALSGRRVEDV